MNKSLMLCGCALVMLVSAGCANYGGSVLPETKKIDYKSAAKAPSLEVPPDLTQMARDSRYTVPDGAGKGMATASGYNAERAGAGKGEQTTILPKVENVRVERAGSERWLVVSAPADKIWDTVKDFWQEMGFIIKIEVPEAGIMETDWAENRAKIPEDVIRSLLGKLIDSLYSTGERDKFRTRMEPGREPGTTDVFISHRGMIEEFSSSSKDATKWQPRPPDPDLEAEMLRRLMVRLGTNEKQAQATIVAAKVEPRAKMSQAADGSGTVEVQEGFDRAWRRVGLALDRVGFTVEDRDRSKGIYFVRYVDPELDTKQPDKGGFIGRLAFWRGSDKPSFDSKAQYRIYVRNVGDATTVQVLTREGGVDKSDTSQRILKLLYEQLK